MVTSFACVEHLQNLQFDSSSNRSSNLPGVSTRISGFGTSAGIEYTDPSWAAYLLGNAGKYALDLVNSKIYYYFYVLKKNLIRNFFILCFFISELVERGYKRDVSIKGAPYDFRFAMSSNTQYFEKFVLNFS